MKRIKIIMQNSSNRKINKNALTKEDLSTLAKLANKTNDQSINISRTSNRLGKLIGVARFAWFLHYNQDKIDSGQIMNTPIKTGYQLCSTYLYYVASKFLIHYGLKAYLQHSRGYYQDNPDWGYNEMKKKFLEIEKDRLAKSLNLQKKIEDISSKSVGIVELLVGDDLNATLKLRSEQIEEKYHEFLFDDPKSFVKSYQEIHRQNPFVIKFAVNLYAKTKQVDDFIKKMADFPFTKTSIQKSEDASNPDKLIVEIELGNPEIYDNPDINMEVLLKNLNKLANFQKKFQPRTKSARSDVEYKTASIDPLHYDPPTQSIHSEKKGASSESAIIIQENLSSLIKIFEEEDFKALFTFKDEDSETKDSSKHLKFQFENEEICKIFKNNFGKFKSHFTIKETAIEDDSKKKRPTGAEKTIDKKSFIMILKDIKLYEYELSEIVNQIKTEIKELEIAKLERQNDKLVDESLSTINIEEAKTKILAIKENNRKIDAINGATPKKQANNFKRQFEVLSLFLSAEAENQFEFSKEKFNELVKIIPAIKKDKNFFRIEEDQDMVKVKFNKLLAFRSDLSMRDCALEKFKNLESAVQEILKEPDTIAESSEDSISELRIPNPELKPLAIEGKHSSVHENREILEAVNMYVKFYADKSSTSSSINSIDKVQSISDFSFGILNEIEFDQMKYRQREKRLKDIFHQKIDLLAKKITTDAPNPLPQETEERAKSLIYFLLNYSSGDAEATAKDIHFLQERGDFKGYHHGLGHASGNNAQQLKKLIITLDRLTEFADDQEKLTLEKLEEYHRKIIKTDDKELQIVEKTAEDLVGNLCNLLQKYPTTDTLQFAKDKICQLTLPEVESREISVEQFIEKKAQIIESLKKDPDKFASLKKEFDGRFLKSQTQRNSSIIR